MQRSDPLCFGKYQIVQPAVVSGCNGCKIASTEGLTSSKLIQFHIVAPCSSIESRETPDWTRADNDNFLLGGCFHCDGAATKRSLCSNELLYDLVPTYELA